MSAEEAVHTHSRGLTKEECEVLVVKEQLDGEELESLLEAREIGYVDFTLVDVREWMEWVDQRIEGTDELIPTTAFYDKLAAIEGKKEQHVILYCLTGSRSAYCQNVLKSMGYGSVGNLTHGIISFHGKTTRGE
jgi:rhodanese-related sulfurtransferase